MAGVKNGEYSRFLNFHGRNPDVLNSIANLSNDEVFTPPEFANRMLDTLEKAWAESNNGENIWANPDLKFLDPFTKSGVFLREITTRLIKGLEPKIPDLQSRVDHILTKQVFGIATTHLTSLMARRSLYCSKKANGKHSITKKFKDESGNIWYEPIAHTWHKGTIREITMDEAGNEVERYVDGKCKYCGASKRDFEREQGLELHAYGLIHNDDPKKWVGEIFGTDMQFDVIIGNPPYQLSTGGGSLTEQAKPLYNLFLSQAKKLQPKYLSMVIPSRWFSGGFGLDGFREEMKSDSKLEVIVDFPDGREVFGENTPAGGVMYFLRNESYNGKCKFSSVREGRESPAALRSLEEHPTIIRDTEDLMLVSVLKSKSNRSFVERVSAVSPFGLPRAARGFPAKAGLKEPVTLWSTAGCQWIERSVVQKNESAIDKWKVLLSATSSEHAGQADKRGMKRVFSKIEVLPPPSVLTHSYLMIGPFESETLASNAATYLRTKFVRYLVSLVALTQQISRGSFEYVPEIDLTKKWSDQELYEYFGLSEEQVNRIEMQIKAIEE
jgi:site-specific DNA-methyltransferase (adenine-specific)